jgi:hypothetical protein
MGMRMNDSEGNIQHSTSNIERPMEGRCAAESSRGKALCPRRALRKKGPRQAFFCFDDCGNPQYYRAIKSTDMNFWRDICPVLSFPKGIRPGMVSMVPAGSVQ